MYCTNCGKKVHEEFSYCPYCGMEVCKEISNKVDNKDVEEVLLFSTESLYNKKHILNIVIEVICVVVAFFLTMFLMLIIPLLGIIFAVLGLIAIITTPARSSMLKQSYIKVYTNKICGVTSVKSKGENKGTFFQVNYSDICCINRYKNEEIILQTTKGEYYVQSYKCVDKVEEIISKQMSINK